MFSLNQFFCGAIVGIMVTVFVFLFMTEPAKADEVEPPSPSKATTRMALRDAFACPGMHAEWIDDKTVECLKEKP